MIGLCVMEISKTDLWSTGIYTIFNPQHRKLMRPLKRLLYKIESEAKEKVSSGIAKNVKRGLFESDFDLFENRNKSIKQLKENLSFIVHPIPFSLWSDLEKEDLVRPI